MMTLGDKKSNPGRSKGYWRKDSIEGLLESNRKHVNCLLDKDSYGQRVMGKTVARKNEIDQYAIGFPWADDDYYCAMRKPKGFKAGAIRTAT